MRFRAVVAIVSLLLPAGASAQRFPLPGTGRPRPGEPVPLPRQPEPIARELAYRRLRLSVESYSLISYVQSPGFTGDGRVSAWTTFGGGTRAEYRLTRLASATLDITSSFVGGPAISYTAEIGTRLRRERSERRMDPFVDLRLGYISAYNRELGSFVNDPFGYPTAQPSSLPSYSTGFGGVAGVGMEYWLTRTLSLTTAGSVMRNQMTARDFQGARPETPSYAMTSYRYTLGFKYNPVRTLRSRGTDLP